VIETRSPVPRAGILDVPLYPGTLLPEPIPGTIKLNSNENLFGPSPNVYEAIRAELRRGELQYYPAVEARTLNVALAAHYGLESDNVLTMGGGELLLPTILQTFVHPDCEILCYNDGFPKYLNYSLMATASLITVSREGDAVSQILGALTPRTTAVLIDNPGNPSGRLLPIEDVRAIWQNLRSDILLILDEAYVEYCDFGDAGLRLATETENTLVVRTFSKAYALAGMRVGWVNGHSNLIRPLRRILPSFPLSRLSLVSALAALADQDHLKRSVAELRCLRDDAASRFQRAGWNVGPCEGNFIVIRRGIHTSDDLGRVFSSLKDGGVLVRPLSEFRGESALRMTIGRAADMARVWDLLRI